MMFAPSYLSSLRDELQKQWPSNQTVNIVCHGHDVPAGYFAAPFVDSFNAYPHLLHRALKERFPFAVINVIVSARGGEASDEGAARFERDVLSFSPDLVTLDYALTDRRIGLYSSEKAHRAMIESALQCGVKVLLLSPSPDLRALGDENEARKLAAFGAQERSLAGEYEVGFEDVAAHFAARGEEIGELMSQFDHPNARGHVLIARALLRWFPVSKEQSEIY